MTLPNELFLEVASHLKSFKDLNSLVRTSHLFHGMFNTQLYRRAVAANRRVLDDIVGWVLSRYLLASLTLLLDNGLSVNHTGRFPRYMYEGTMLCFLCSWLDDHERSVPLARLLIQRGADTNAVGLWGYTPLHFASWINDARMVNLLIAHGADIEARSVAGDTPLNVSSRYGKRLAMEALLEHGADAGAHNDEGVTPLHCLIQYLWDTSSDRLFMARFLLENGADVNAISNDGLSPLQRALNSGCEGNGFALLLEHGADVRVLNEEQRRRLSRISRSTA
jgi:ankyrin repeat protein